MTSKAELHLRNLAARHRYKIIKLGPNLYLLGNEAGISIGDPGTLVRIEQNLERLILIALEQQLHNVNAPVTRKGNMFKTNDGTWYDAKEIKKWWNKRCQSSLRI